jgi:WD40 repeat protein
MEFDPKNRDVLLYSEDGFVYIVPLGGAQTADWDATPIAAHDISYSSDGNSISISSLDGGSWFYSRPRATWSYAHDHDAEVWSGQFSPDGEYFVSIDRNGMVAGRSLIPSKPKQRTH